MKQELTLVQRAAVALNSSKYELELVELINKTKDLVEIKDNAGRDQIHRAGMTLSNTRIEIAKTGKESREDATQFSKAVIAEEKRLIDLIKPEEDRIFAIRDSWDAHIEAAKQAKIAAERARVTRIKGAIEEIRNIPASCVGKSISEMGNCLRGLESSTYPEDFYQEFIDEVVAVDADVKEKLLAMINLSIKAEALRVQEKQEREAEAARLKAEREENERIRKQLAEQQAIIDAQVEEQRKAQQLEQAKAKAAQDKLNAERAAFEAEKQSRIDADNKLLADATLAEQQEIEENKRIEEFNQQQLIIASRREDKNTSDVAKNQLIIADEIEKKAKITRNSILSAVAQFHHVSELSAAIAIHHYFNKGE